MPDILIARLEEDTKIYLTWLKSIERRVEKGALLAGPCLTPDYPVYPRSHDNFHFPLGMRKLLALGFSGIRDTALKNADRFNGNQKKYLLLIHEVYKAQTGIIAAFARAAENQGCGDIQKICANLANNAPRSFLEACQLYWFSALFRIGTATIGRIDQHLYPFFLSDIEKGILDPQNAASVISELLQKYEKRGASKGDTLQNATLGGMDAQGIDQTNDLTYMILRSCIAKKQLEPKINVRLNKNSPRELLELVSEMQNSGMGICTVFNDEVIIDGLMKYGRPAKVADDYCADGCSEIILDGTGETQFRYIDCVKAVEHTLFNGEENVPEKKKMQYYSVLQDQVEIKPPVEKGIQTGDFTKMGTFNRFYQAYIDQLKYQTKVILSKPYNSDEAPLRLFTAATMPDVIETAREPFTNDSCYHTYGLFIGSLGTAINSIAAVKYLVYEKQLVKKEELLLALKENYEGHPALRSLCRQAPKYGNDDDYTDALAADIARQFASWVREYKDRMGKSIVPGLYNHIFHHTAYYVGATPDGRKYGDPVGEHLSPTPGTAKNGPTAVINSLCKVNTKEQIFGSTLHLNIPRISLGGVEDEKKILQYLTNTFCRKGGSVLNINVLNAEVLRMAQKIPEMYKDLIVRVWGFSYYFTLMSKEMQEHIIARAEGR